MKMRYLSYLLVFCLALPATCYQSQVLGQTQSKQAVLSTRADGQSEAEFYAKKRQTFDSAIAMLRKAHVPFAPEILLSPGWREKVTPFFEQMPNQKVTLNNEGKLKGAFVANTLYLPEQTELSGDVILMARHFIFEGKKGTIKGRYKIYFIPLDSIGLTEESEQVLDSSGGRVNSPVTIDARGNTNSKSRKKITRLGGGSPINAFQQAANFTKPIRLNGISSWDFPSNYLEVSNLFNGLTTIGTPAQANGDPGNNGTPGTHGSQGDGGSRGNDGGDGTCSGVDGLPGFDGGNGTDGGEGGDGGDGDDGENGGWIYCYLPCGESVSLYADGGKGGDGGRGGDGGSGGVGGRGGDGGDGADCSCAQGGAGDGGNGGNGGNGGEGKDGGDGGNGGDGGSGGSIQIDLQPCCQPGAGGGCVSGFNFYFDCNQSFYATAEGGQKGLKGQGGNGGMAGQAGLGGSGGQGGQGTLCSPGGTGGSNGQPGMAGISSGSRGSDGQDGHDGWDGMICVYQGN